MSGGKLTPSQFTLIVAISLRTGRIQAQVLEWIEFHGYDIESTSFDIEIWHG